MLLTLTGKGDLFGSDIDYEEAVIKSSCDVKSLTYCDLQCIHLAGFKGVLDMYPEFADKCANDLLHDLTYNLREGYVEMDDDDVTITPAITLPAITEETSDEKESAGSEDEADSGSDTDQKLPATTLPSPVYPASLPQSGCAGRASILKWGADQQGKFSALKSSPGSPPEVTTRWGFEN